MEDKKMNGKKLQGAETKRKIIESADLLFKEYGFENVSVDSIVEKSGISKGGFYVHFDSKDALTAALIAQYVYELDLSYESFLETFPESAETSAILLSLIGKIADTVTDRIGYNLIKIAYRIQIDRNISTEVLLSYNRNIYGVFNEIIRRGIRLGEFKTELSEEALTRHFIMAIRGLMYEWCIRYPGFDLKRESETHFRLLLCGIRT